MDYHDQYYMDGITETGLPKTHSLLVFDVLEPKFTFLKFALCMKLTL